MKLSIFLLAVLAYHASAAPSDSDTSILKTLQSKKTTTVIIDVNGSDLFALRRHISTQTFATRGHKINALYSAMKQHADTHQENILNFLNEQKTLSPILIEQLWISNQIIVKNADYALVQALLKMDEVKAVREDEIIPLEQPRDLLIYPQDTVPKEDQWGVRAIKADQVHLTGNKGGKAVIGTIDTGVRATHEALRDAQRPTHSWFDPYSATEVASDQNGHGTHTMGTILGRTRGIGVAPEASWISCKGCNTDGCAWASLLLCGQFMFCPTNPKGLERDCSKAPDAVSNSWGGGGGSTMFDDVIDSWLKVEIAPIFAIGNEGPRCGTAQSPGDSIGAIAVGSLTEDDVVSEFSSLGPTRIGARMKPDIAAPGSYVISSYHLSDDAYATMSGTSMATPHVAGLAALLYTNREGLTVSEIRSALTGGAEHVITSDMFCGEVPDTVYPNHIVGHGRVNAVESLKTLQSL